MSLYHEAAAALTAPEGGNLKTHIFGTKTGGAGAAALESRRAPPAQVYALAIETAKWSHVLSEVIDASELLVHERRRLQSSPVLALLLVHDLLLARDGIRLPPTHGLYAAVARHKARLTAELTRARLRRRAPTLDALRQQVELATVAASVADGAVAAATRWVRVNALKTTLEAQLDTTFSGYERVSTLAELWTVSPDGSGGDGRRIYVDEHVPNLVAIPLLSTASSSSSSSADLTRSEAYRTGAIIFQDKASCFPAYLLDPSSVSTDDGEADFVDACAAPGNKTSHLAAIVRSLSVSTPPRPCIFAFEKDTRRAKTLQSMLRTAGALDMVTIAAGQDFLQVDPTDARYARVRALLLDPSCSGSGIVGRDDMPQLHLPRLDAEPKPTTAAAATRGKKRKRVKETDTKADLKADTKADTKAYTQEKPEADEKARLDALSTFQLTLLLHAMRFPAARRVTYSTCSVHAQENEQVVVQALAAAAANKSGWRLLRREEQVSGMRAWPVRGDASGAQLDGEKVDEATAVADACIRSYPDDGRGVMGFFVAAFVREDNGAESGDGSEWGGFDD